MRQQEMFADAVWVSAPQDWEEPAFILRKTFSLPQVCQAQLRVVGLGHFHCYINGNRVGEDWFLPLNTDYEPRQDMPKNEVLTGHRLYVPEYDVTQYLRPGENTLALHFGCGWYRSEGYGRPKAIYTLFGKTRDGEFRISSEPRDKIGKSYVNQALLAYCTCNEQQDYTICTHRALQPGFDDAQWENAIPVSGPDTQYLFSDCPADRLQRQLSVTLVGKIGDKSIYDCGINTTGYPVLNLTGKKGEKVHLVLGEELDETGNIHPDHSYNQEFFITDDGQTRQVHPEFCWYGFRYFSVEGQAQPTAVQQIYTQFAPAGGFSCNVELLNWIHDTFLHTASTNMHGGIPSDCPQIERRGYTGDGQLTCHALMHMLDAEAFYRKWVGDILDSQDVLSGHIQNTAPYTLSGGGPGGWGSAVVEVPYQLYRHYGNRQVLEEAYPAMGRYFDYLESRSKNNLVYTDIPGISCLGDWCPPDHVKIPPALVNNYFYIKSLKRAVEIARVLGKQEDIEEYQRTIQLRKDALMAAYFDEFSGSFVANAQGANAFALDVGAGNEKTYPFFLKYYQQRGGLDTGIFATELVCRILFENGDGETAVNLLTSRQDSSFYGWQQRGATTFWEYWPQSLEDRSHNHPMFGAVVSCFYDYLLGIGQEQDSAGYEKLVLHPRFVPQIHTLSGWKNIPSGRIEISYRVEEQEIVLKAVLPQDAVLRYRDERVTLKKGTTELSLPRG